MTVHEVAEMLDARDQPAWPRQILARLQTAGRGNPRTVLALSHALAERVQAAGGELPDATEPLPVPDALRGPIRARLDTLPARARHTLLTASAAASPSEELLHRAAAPARPPTSTCASGAASWNRRCTGPSGSSTR